MRKTSRDIELLTQEMCNVFNIPESKKVLLENILLGLYLDGIIQGKEECTE